ncbi:DUF6456 domain-containing protein [Roseibium sp.]|uniref:DUF6456 domain-containing protein n=1 Tax=Roseibium sp. TaxID=1936156 RepID=UPI003D12AC0B
MTFLSVNGADRRERIRLLRNLSSKGAELVREFSNGPVRWVLLRDLKTRSICWSDRLIVAALSAGVLVKAGQNTCRISPEGRAALRRALSGTDDVADQHRDIRQVSCGSVAAKGVGKRPASAKINISESPLARLAARKKKNGQPLLNPEEVQAGERLRADYTFASMMPAIGQGWRTERITAGGFGTKDLNDDVLSARQRVETVLESLEPVLAGVLVDVCCHLKGLEKVEAERGWPARCAKIILQIALSALADRYGERTQAPSRPTSVRSWSSAP